MSGELQPILGMGKPELLADNLGISLYSTAAGLIICPIGIACIIIAVIFLQRAKREATAIVAED